MNQTFGHLLTDMGHAADAPIRIRQFLQPRAEPEIALVLGSPLRGPRVSVSDVVAAAAYAVPAIEIIDSRIGAWKIGIVDTIADNASSGGFVIGQSPLPLDRLDLSLTGCVLRWNGRIVATGAASRGSRIAAARRHLARQRPARPRCGAGGRSHHPDRLDHSRDPGSRRGRGDGEFRPPGLRHRTVRLITAAAVEGPLAPSTAGAHPGQAISGRTCCSGPHCQGARRFLADLACPESPGIPVRSHEPESAGTTRRDDGATHRHRPLAAAPRRSCSFAAKQATGGARDGSSGRWSGRERAADGRRGSGPSP